MVNVSLQSKKRWMRDGGSDDLGQFLDLTLLEVGYIPAFGFYETPLILITCPLLIEANSSQLLFFNRKRSICICGSLFH